MVCLLHVAFILANKNVEVASTDVFYEGCGKLWNINSTPKDLQWAGGSQRHHKLGSQSGRERRQMKGKQMEVKYFLMTFICYFENQVEASWKLLLDVWKFCSFYFSLAWHRLRTTTVNARLLYYPHQKQSTYYGPVS